MRRGAIVLGLVLAANSARAQEQAPPPKDAAPAAQDEAARKKSEDDRLKALEERVEEQQRMIEALIRDREAAAVRGKPPGAPAFQWGFDDSFFVKGTVNGASFSIRPRGGIQLDYRAFPNQKPENQFVLRRARVGFDGNFGVFGFEIQVQPLRGPIPFVDAYLEWRQFEEIRIRAGHFKTPFSLDNGVIGDFKTDTIERPMVLSTGGQALSPDFHPGAEVHGSFSEGILSYRLSAQNVVDSNSVQQSDPLVAARLETSYSGVSIGVAGFWERLAKTTSFKGLTPGQFEFFAPVAVRGWTQAYEVDLSILSGPVWLRAEYAYGRQERRRVLADGADGTPLVTQGGYVTLGWVFWGPPADVPHPITSPFANWSLFSMEIEKSKRKRTVGAAIVTRLEWVRFDDERGGRRLSGGNPAVPSTAADAAKVRGNEAVALTGGLNLCLAENVELQFNYVRLRIGDQARAESRHSRWSDEFLLRAQLDF